MVAASDENPLDHVRRRPGMYIGSARSHGLLNVVLEVVSNCFDQVLGQAASRISVTMGPGRWVTVVDDGPGIAFDHDDGPGSLEDLFTTIRHTPTADGHSPHVHLSVGTGLGPICALMDEVQVEVRRSGVRHRQAFARGRARSPLETDDATGPTGTTIRLLPDPSIFDTDAVVPVEELTHRLRELALLHPGLTTEVTVEGQDPVVTGPVADLAPLFDATFGSGRHDTEPDPPFLLSSRTGDTSVDLALGWATFRHGIEVASYGNYRYTRESGMHVDGIEEGLREVFGPAPMGALLAGLRGVVHVRLHDPQFPGPTRERLASPEAIWAVADTIATRLPDRLGDQHGLAESLARRVPSRRSVAEHLFTPDERHRPVSRDRTEVEAVRMR